MFSNLPLKYIVALLLGFALMVAPLSAASEEKSSSGAGGTSNGLQQRIDFGSAYIMGQSIKSGAVYLMHRKQSKIDSMLDVRVNYRKEIMEDYDLENTKIVSVESTPVEEKKTTAAK